MAAWWIYWLRQTPSEQIQLSAAEQRTLEQRMQKRQVKEFMGAFGGLVEHCFMSCVDDFTSKAISTRESGCINRCVQKWMASQQRISDRFQEHNAQLTAQMNK
ncbi:Tim10/DDP family zinc finger-domain-containing protein [Fusarium tricinctum]|uniref:Mitochondrial import inner membrane translocase subunit n=1 Tax=Fusarium tricinctum TaxID=61284 RepID=A0A8K0WHL4_9HYPO|nr:Tim10/DDP family zinc finger-domain-containing protein [Fusarium tricinctum]